VSLFLGDDGTSKEATSTGKLNQENEHIYNLWCSGRVCCEGMLIQLKVACVFEYEREKHICLICVFTSVIVCCSAVSEKTRPAECAGQDDETSL